MVGGLGLRDDVIQRQLSDAIIRGDAETAETKAKILAQYAKNPTEALDDLYDAFRAAEGLHALGEYDEDRFSASARAASAALTVLKSSLNPRQSRFTARICVGPVSGGGDVMSSIMAAMLAAAGHEVTDLSRVTTPKELLRNAEQSNAEFLVVSFNEKTGALAREFANEFDSGGFRSKFRAIAFARGLEQTPIASESFEFVAHQPLELLSKTTEFLIRRRGAVPKELTDGSD